VPGYPESGKLINLPQKGCGSAAAGSDLLFCYFYLIIYNNIIYDKIKIYTTMCGKTAKPGRSTRPDVKDDYLVILQKYFLKIIVDYIDNR